MYNPVMTDLYKLLPMEHKDYKRLLKEYEGKTIPFISLKAPEPLNKAVEIEVKAMEIENGKIRLKKVKLGKDKEKILDKIAYEFAEEIEQGRFGFYRVSREIFDMIKNKEVI